MLTRYAQCGIDSITSAMHMQVIHEFSFGNANKFNCTQEADYLNNLKNDDI